MIDVPVQRKHIPVLIDETLSYIKSVKCKLVIDATLGLGGHAEAILEAMPDATLIGMDQDQTAIGFAGERLKRFGTRFEAVHDNFRNIRLSAESIGNVKPDAILADLGVSSLQLDDPERGFSFRFDAPLDMRMNQTSTNETVAQYLERTGEEDLANVIFKYGEERNSRRIARRIKERIRSGEGVQTTFELADLVKRSVKYNPKEKIHPATRTFQALRIAVNEELDVLEGFIDDAFDVLANEGRLAIITFHSLEDRIVKQSFLKFAGKCLCPPRIPKCVCGAKKRGNLLTRKPIAPSEDEISQNPRSRSAKLRVFQKLELN
jgi:16S rRNA (cytosine1402-N4)-methyltransferase